MTREQITECLSKKGFEILGTVKTVMGSEIVSAQIETTQGKYILDWCENGSVRQIKPNGSVKWLYQKSLPQINRAINQVLEANNWEVK